MFKELGPGRKLGDYTVVGRSYGSHADLYEGRHERRGTKVAIRVASVPLFDEEATRRFLAGRTKIEALREPSLVRVLDGDVIDDARVYAVTEWSEGKSLADLKTAGRLELPVLLDVLEQMARGLAALHTRGIAHGPIEQGEVLLDGDRVRMTGVAFARLRVAAEPDAVAADVTSLGFLALEMLGGRPASLHLDQLMLWMIAALECAPTIAQVLVELGHLRRAAVAVTRPSRHLPPPPPPGSRARLASSRVAPLSARPGRGQKANVTG